MAPIFDKLKPYEDAAGRKSFASSVARRRPTLRQRHFDQLVRDGDVRPKRTEIGQKNGAKKSRQVIDAGLSGLVNQVFGQREPLLQLPIGRQSVALVLRVDDVSVLVDLESKDGLRLK